MVTYNTNSIFLSFNGDMSYVLLTSLVRKDVLNLLAQSEDAGRCLAVLGSQAFAHHDQTERLQSLVFSKNHVSTCYNMGGGAACT